VCLRCFLTPRKPVLCPSRLTRNGNYMETTNGKVLESFRRTIENRDDGFFLTSVFYCTTRQRFSRRRFDLRSGERNSRTYNGAQLEARRPNAIGE